ncbi:MAG: hypothetical protein KDD82_15140 [Planctomycetes bacterium]|nr:hypothetical protein [Planctomycetota bacterium]
MKGSLAGPPPSVAPAPSSGRSLRSPPRPASADPWRAHAQLAAARELHDGERWLPAGLRARALLQARLRAAYAAAGLVYAGSEDADALRTNAGPDAVLAAARDLQRALGWETVVEQVLGPGAPAWPGVELSTPRLRPGRELVIHAELAGSRWESGRVREVAGALEGSLCSFASTLLRLADQGPWPGWLAPTQVHVLPVGAAQAPLASAVCAELRRAGLRAEAHSEGTLGRRVRDAGQGGVPGVAVLGAREASEGTVALRWRGAPEVLPRVDLVARACALIDSQTPRGVPITRGPSCPHPQTGDRSSPNPLQEF